MYNLLVFFFKKASIAFKLYCQPTRLLVSGSKTWYKLNKYLLMGRWFGMSSKGSSKCWNDPICLYYVLRCQERVRYFWHFPPHGPSLDWPSMHWDLGRRGCHLLFCFSQPFAFGQMILLSKVGQAAWMWGEQGSLPSLSAKVHSSISQMLTFKWERERVRPPFCSKTGCTCCFSPLSLPFVSFWRVQEKS